MASHFADFVDCERPRATASAAGTARHFGGHGFAFPDGSDSTKAGEAKSDRYRDDGGRPAETLMDKPDTGLPPLEFDYADPASLAGLGNSELKHLRRAFAMQYHPDRVAPELRELANLRMARFNEAIDRALRIRRETGAR